MGREKEDGQPQEEYSVEKVLQKRTRNGKVIKFNKDPVDHFTYQLNFIVGWILSQMEGIFWCWQHMGARRESRLSRFDFRFRGESEKERTSDSWAKETKGEWAAWEIRQEKIRSQGRIRPWASTWENHRCHRHLWGAYVPHEMEGHRRSWFGSSETSKRTLPSNRDPILRGTSHMAFQFDRKELSWFFSPTTYRWFKELMYKNFLN